MADRHLKSVLQDRRLFFKACGQESGRRLDRIDVLLLAVLMLVYSLAAFINLGSVHFPETVWKAKQGETLIVDLGEQMTVSKAMVNGSIATGTLAFYADDDTHVEFEQVYGDMYRWKEVPLSLTTRYVRLFDASGEIAFNEIALYDERGELIPIGIYEGYGSQACAFDEQSTIPEQPSYLDGMYFDEIYHARTAYELLIDTELATDVPEGATDYSYVKENGYSIYEWTHPQLGKLLIAVGIRLFGMNPFGWRFMGTLFGVLILAVLYVLAKRIFRRSDFAFVAAALFAVDCMHFSQTRIATIDVYALFFTLLMFLFLFDYMNADREDAPFWKRMLWLGLAGLSFGLGASSKWTCIYSGAGLAVLFFVTFAIRCVRIFKMRREQKKQGNRKPAPVNWFAILPVLFGLAVIAFIALNWSTYQTNWYDVLFLKKVYIPFFILVGLAVLSSVLFRLYVKGKDRFDLSVHNQWMTLVWCCVFFIVIPIALYYATSYCYYITENRVTFYEKVACLWQKQIQMYNYHHDLDATHLCQSMWYQWPLAQKAVWFYSGYPDGMLSNISSTGNPAVWYVSAFGAVMMAVEWCLNAKCRKDPAFFLVLVGILAGLLPWTLVTRCVFLYHYFSTLPFVLLAALLLLYYMEQKHPRLAPLKWVWFIVALVFFILMYPAISGTPTSYAYAGFIEHVLTVFGKVYYVTV